jgi:hypothetical protein
LPAPFFPDFVSKDFDLCIEINALVCHFKVVHCGFTARIRSRFGAEG